MKEIERKFFIKTMPDLSGLIPWRSESFFLKSKDGFEERISRIQDKFYYDKKNTVSSIERNRDKKEITKNEFNNLKSRTYGPTMRDTYLLSNNPKITLQIYRGEFEGLIRAEVEFNSIKEAGAFKPLSWIGKEIASLDIARDSTNLNTSQLR